ncbi:MAG: efflux RND transporter permease subunit [Cytophagales bacterium]|nr:efflux RND transporter permease subunit [Cytophagales bacterium]
MKGLISYFAKHPIWANVTMGFIVVLGIISTIILKRSFFPERPIKNIFVDVAYLGASPEEMEEGVVIKVEEALKGIKGVEEVSSTASENTAQIKVVCKKQYDIDELLSDVKNAVDQISSFPENAEKPKVYKEKPLGSSIFLSLYNTGENDLMALKYTADQIENDFLNSGVISQVVVTGIPALEISIEISESKLLKYGININQISQAVAKNNRDISGGSIKSTDEEILIRSRNKSVLENDIKNIIVKASEGGGIIRIKDIASVKQQFAESPQKTIFNGQQAIGINIFKLPEEDIIKITDFVKDYIEEHNQTHETSQLTVIRDMSIPLNQRIALLADNGWKGFVLVLVVLGLFLNTRLSFWVAMGLPISFLGMITIANACGVTMNQISLFGMILVIGILVDDGIVIAENIHSQYEKKKKPLDAVIDGVLEVLPSVFTSVLTTIIVFVSFFFLDGSIGDTILEMAIVVIACLAVSLVEAVLILPAHLYVKNQDEKGENKIRKVLNKGIDYVRFKLYGALLKKILEWRWAVLGFPILFIAFIFGAMGGGIIKQSFFPFIDGDDISVTLEFPQGTREIETEKTLLYINEKIWEINQELSKQRKDTLQVVNFSRLNVVDGHKGTIDVQLLDGKTRNIPSFEISNMIRERVGTIPNAQEFTIGGRRYFGKPISIRLLHNNGEELELAKEELKLNLSNNELLKDITDSDEEGKRELNITLKPKAYLLGLSHFDITQQIRQGFFGQEAQRLQVGKDEVRVWVRYPISGRTNIGQLENIKIKVQNKQYPLSELVDYTIERGITKIIHYNGYKQINVEASLANPNNSATEILSEIEETVLNDLKSKYKGLEVEFGGQKKSSQQFMRSAMLVLPVVILAIYALIALVFRSYSQPFLILGMIPLGILCAILGHYIEGKAIVIMSWLGMIALSGVIINDAVVFLEKFNQNLRNGMKVFDAVYDAGISRFRAIMLTSITTVAGLYPLIFEDSVQAQFLIPMAITMAYGVAFGTLLILIVFPALIFIKNDFRIMRRWIWEGEKPTREEVEPAYKESIDHE